MGSKASALTLVDLATQILENARKLESGLPESPTFEKDTIPSLPDDLQFTRKALIDQTEILNALVRGSDGPLGRVINSTYKYLDDIALEAIYHFRIAQRVPFDAGISFADLAAKCGIDEGRLTRLVRHAMTFHMFQEPRPGYVSHTSDSRLLVEDPAIFDVVGSIHEDMKPAALKVTEAMEKWPGTSKPTESGFQISHNTKESFYDFMSKDAEKIRRFSNHLVYLERTDPYTTQQVPFAYPWSQVAANGTVVDIGGGNGQYSIAIAQKHPSIKCIVQDLPGVSSGGPENVPQGLRDRVCFQEHDAFTTQTVEADVYFLRHVFHNWPDTYCVKILRNLIPALKPGARILLCDVVIPNTTNVEQQFVRRWDLLMLSLFNARERSIEDMAALFEMADERFKFQGVYNHAGAMDKIVEAIWTPES